MKGTCTLCGTILTPEPADFSALLPEAARMAAAGLHHLMSHHTDKLPEVLQAVSEAQALAGLQWFQCAEPEYNDSTKAAVERLARLLDTHWKKIEQLHQPAPATL